MWDLAYVRTQCHRRERSRNLGTGRGFSLKITGVKRGLLKAWQLVNCSVQYWVADNASTTGAALAFYCAFSLAPLLIIILTLAGKIIGDTAANQQVASQLTAMFGPATAQILLSAVRSSQHTKGGLSTVVSVITLLVGATTVFAALEGALEQIWNTRSIKRAGVRGWIRTRLLSLGFILALGFLLLVSLTVSTALATARELLEHRYAGVFAILGALDLVVSLTFVAGIFALIYRWMPAQRLRWAVVIRGGLLTAVLFDLGRWAISIYLAHATEPSAFGAAASFAALLLWLYYTAQIFLFGAEFTACLGGLRDRPVSTSQANVGHLGT
jgi:membrane protein